MFRVGFLGRGRLGFDVLQGLLANPEVEVPIIVCCAATPEVADTLADIKTIARQRNIDYFETNNINKPQWEKTLAGYGLDLAVAMLWLHTIGAGAIATAKFGFVNCHGGHLPKYRGNACANWAILNGETRIGVSAHLMAPGELDSGPIILQDWVDIGPNDYVGDIIQRIEEKGKRLVLGAVDALRTGTATLTPQDEAVASYCYPRIPRDGEIDWTLPAEDVRRLIRSAGRPYPGAYSWFQDHRAGGTIRKLTIWRAKVEHHPLNEFYCAPGHLIRLAPGEKWAIVCGDKNMLLLEEIEVDGVPVAASAFFRTVRQRIGLDQTTLAVEAARRLDALESLGATAARFTRRLSGETEQLEQEVSRALETAIEALPQGISAVANPLRNYSFQKRWFDWEQRERWFGIQIYQSLRLTGFPKEPYAIGYWLFSDDSGNINRRIYVSVKEEYAATLGLAAQKMFVAVVPGTAQHLRTEEGHVQGIYSDIGAGIEDPGTILAELAQNLAAR